MNLREDGNEHCKDIILKSRKTMESSILVGDNEQQGEKVKNYLEESIEIEPT